MLFFSSYRAQPLIGKGFRKLALAAAHGELGALVGGQRLLLVRW